MSTFKIYLEKTQKQTVTNESIFGALFVILPYILGTILYPNKTDGQIKYDKNELKIEEIEKIEKEGPKVIESFKDPKLTEAFQNELKNLQLIKTKLENKSNAKLDPSAFKEKQNTLYTTFTDK